jgi:hypothetical protein
MTLAIYTRPTDGTQDSATVALEVTFLDPAVDMPLTKDSVSSAGARSLFGYLQLFHKWRDPDSNRGHHDFQSVYVCAALYRDFLTNCLNMRTLGTF